MNRFLHALRYTVRSVFVLAQLAGAASAAESHRPNVLWFIVDDMSANFSCYGEDEIETPHVDRLAEAGTRFINAFVTAPVCSPCRSAFITGMYQTAIGAHHHRSGRGDQKIRLPADVVPVPVLFQQAGYYTCIGDGLSSDKQSDGRDDRLGKTDYNFEWDRKMYDGNDWTGRRPGQPFFMQVQMPGGKLRGGTSESARRLAERANAEFGEATDPQAVTLPPYYPRDPILLEDWAAYLDAVRFTDQHVGNVIDRLRHEGILDQTLVILMTDHGISHARGKQFLYNEGTHIPFIVRGPEIPRGAARDDLIEQIDIAAISLAAAGIELPKGMHARNVFADDYKPREAVFAARDRCDETVDQIRSVRTREFLYIRNFLPQRPPLQPNAYKDAKSIVQRLRDLHEQGELNPRSESLLFSSVRPSEELYEWTIDRWQIENLAEDSKYRGTLVSLRNRLDRWLDEANDPGAESDVTYDREMGAFLSTLDDERAAAVRRNIALMKRWASEGR